jgi:2'-5' RNA ligase
MSICITSSRQVQSASVNAGAPFQAADADNIISQMRKSGKLPASLTESTVDAMKKSLNKYFAKISSDKIQEAADKAREIVEQTLKTEETAGTETGLGTSGARSQLDEFFSSMTGANVAETMNLDFFIRIAQEVALGAGNYIAQNSDETRVQEFPALELVRVYPRKVPRGSTDRDGDDDWPTRWENAGGELVDGRMVALKSDDIWQALGDAEGYDDGLGNPFPPFAFNSGFDVEEVSREDAEALGLLEPGEEAKPAQIDFSDLFSLPTEARAGRTGGFPGTLPAPARSGFALARLRTNLGQIEAGGESAKRGCLMAMICGTLEDTILAWLKKNIPEDQTAGDGVETEPHITILYGFNPDMDVTKLHEFCQAQKPVTLILGKISRFDCPDYDVLKVDIRSGSAERLNAAISENLSDDITPSEHDYHPHLTLAYLKKGALKELDGRNDFNGFVVTKETLLYSLPKRQGRENIELKGGNA